MNYFQLQRFGMHTPASEFCSYHILPVTLSFTSFLSPPEKNSAMFLWIIRPSWLSLTFPYTSYDFTTELQEFAKEELGKLGREDEVVKLMEDVEREKAEAIAAAAEAAENAKASARAAVSSLIPSKLFGNKGLDEDSSANTENAEATAENGEVQAGKEENGIDQVGDIGSSMPTQPRH